MGAFLDWFFEFMTTMLKDGVLRIFTGIFWGIVQIFNIPDYISIFNSHSSGFSAIEWVLSIFAMIVIFLIWALLITLAVFGLRKYFRFRRSIVGNEDLLEELADMHRDVLRLTKEKERIMALKIGQTSISVDDLNAILNPDEEGNASIEEARAAGLAGAAGRVRPPFRPSVSSDFPPSTRNTASTSSPNTTVRCRSPRSATTSAPSRAARCTCTTRSAPSG